MAQRSEFSSLNFSIDYFLPPVRGGIFLGKLDISSQNWIHQMSAFGGFDRAEFTVVDTREVYQDWIEDGIGRTVRAYDETGETMWEGFVNRINILQAGLEYTIGPIVDIVNRAKLIYSNFDTSTEPPFEGIRRETLINDNRASQLLYGIFYKALNAAGVTDANAPDLRDKYLEEYAWPEHNKNFSPQTSGIEMNVECLGFLHRLDYPYNNVLISSGLVQVSTKIRQILASDPNVLFTQHDRIIANETLVPEWEDENRSGLDLLKSLASVGDLNLNRWTLGAYEDRIIEYKQVEVEPEYFTALGDVNHTVYDRTENVVPPWRVRPGKWIMFTDFLPAYTPTSTDLNQDPRMLFIESLRFELPFGVDLNGGKTTRLDQKLAQLGLGGISA